MMIRRRGFSLTEAMMVVAILGILASVGPALILQINNFFLMSRARTAIQQEARSAMYVISRNLHQARYLTVAIDNATGQPYSSRINFTKQQGQTVSFYQSGRNLVMQEGSRVSILSKNIRYLAFTFPRSDDMGIISVSMTLEKATYLGRTSALHMASERVRLMNQ